MNIYDEAIENTQVLLALLDITKTPNVSKKFKMLREIENALKRAKKVELLFEIYKNAWECGFMSDEEERQANKLEEELK